MYVLERKGGLRAFYKGQKGSMKEYFHKDRSDEGEFVGEYKDPSIPGTKQFLLALWNDRDNAFGWYGSEEDLKEVVEKVKLRFEDGEFAGKVITYKDVDRFNRFDPFFTHSHWTFKHFTNGKLPLFPDSNAEDKFIFLNHRGCPKIVEMDGEKSPYAQSAKIAIRSYAIKQKADKEEVNLTIEAVKVYGAMEFERKKLVAKALKLPINVDNPDTLDAELGKIALAKDSKDLQEKFLKFGKMPTKDLEILSNIESALRKRVLVNKEKWYELITPKNSKLESSLKVDKESDLLNFFKTNEEYYYAMVDTMEQREKANKASKKGGGIS